MLTFAKKIMNIFSFSAHFSSEEDCRNHFKCERDKIGVTCSVCGNTTHYWTKRCCYECKNCRHRTSLHSGTIMQNSNLSFMIWYLQLYLNEFVYKLNRRYFGDRIFDRLIIANITGL